MDILPIHLQPIFTPALQSAASRPQTASGLEATAPETPGDQFLSSQPLAALTAVELPDLSTLENALEQGLKRLKSQPELCETAQALRRSVLPLLQEFCPQIAH